MLWIKAMKQKVEKWLTSVNAIAWTAVKCIDKETLSCVEKKNQLDATEGFIALIICLACFGHFYAHHQELETICVLLPPMVCGALVARCWSGAGQPAMRPEWGMLLACLLAGTCQLASSQRTCVTYTWSCRYSLGLLMMDGETVRNI